MAEVNDITELKAENERLRAELEKARERERDFEEARKAMLFMLEDLEKSRDAIERGKREWEETFDAISDPLFIHDREFRIARANLAYKDAAGMKFKEFIGRPYYEVFPKMEGPFKMCLKALELQEEEFYYINKVYKVRFYPIKNVNGKYLYSIHILEDITEAKKAADRIKEEMEVTAHLLMISEATARTTDIDRLMEQVVHCGHEIMKCDICLSYLWDEESKVFQPCQEFGLPHDMVPLFRTGPIDEKMEFVKEVLSKEEPVVEYVGAGLAPARKGQPQGLPLQWIPDIHTLAAVPLIGKTGFLGLIIGIYSKPLEVAERDRDVMKGISNQVSVALEQARFYKESVDKTLELSHKIETIKVMNQIDRSILSTLESQEILETVTRLIAKVIPCERATVGLVDMERRGFIFAAGFGLEFIPKGKFVPFEATSATEVVETGRVQYVANLMDVKEPLPVEAGMIREGFLSHIRVPLLVRQEVAGVLVVGAKRPSAYSPEDLSTLEKLAYQIGVALSNARLISDLEELFIGTVKSLSSAIDAKSPWTAGHSERVTKYALDIAKEMGLSEKELKDLELAGLLHDVGKIGTYESILDKPARLDEEEQAVMRLHPVKGAEILAPIKQLKEIIPGVKYHHEFYDGTGYPDGLKGEEIPLLARILTVADTFDAMSADRPYRTGRTMEFILEEFKKCSGTQFDPNVVEVFLKTLQKQPF